MCPNTQDLKIEHSRIEFLDSCSALPATAPADHAHIIDLSTFKLSTDRPERGIELQDAIVTMLYNISPVILTIFLNPPAGLGTFRLVQKYINKSSTDKLVIMKKGDKVLVSALASQ